MWYKTENMLADTSYYPAFLSIVYFNICKVLQTVPKYSSRAALFHLLLADYNSWIILTVNLTLCSIAAISNSA